MLRIRTSALIVLACLAGSVPARAQVFGQYTGAETVPMGGHMFGAYLSASDNFFGLLGQLRLSFYPDVDFGFQGGLTRVDFGSSEGTTVRLGGDFKYLAGRTTQGLPFDLALGGALGVETGDDISVLTLGPTATVSRNMTMGSSTSFAPYASLGFMFSNLDIFDSEQTQFSVPIRLGAEFRLSQELRLAAEFQFRVKDDYNDNVSFVTGVNLPF